MTPISGPATTYPTYPTQYLHRSPHVNLHHSGTASFHSVTTCTTPVITQYMVSPLPLTRILSQVTNEYIRNGLIT